VAFLWFILIRIPTQYPKIGAVWAIDDVAKVQKCLKKKRGSYNDGVRAFVQP